MAANRIYIQVLFDSENAEANAKQLNKAIEATGIVAENTNKKAASSVKGFSVSMQSATDEVARFGRALAAVGVARGMQQLVAMGEEWNRLTRQFSTLGIADQAEQFKQLANNLGVSQEDVAQIALRLHAAGIPADRLAANVERLVEASQALGKGGAQGARDLGEAISRIGAMAAPSTKAIQGIFKELNFNITQATAKQLQKPLLDLKEEARLLDPQKFMQFALAVITAQGNIHQAAAREAQTVNAATNRLKNSLTKMASDVDETFGKSIIRVIGLLEKMLDLVDRGVKSFSSLSQPIKDAAVAVGLLATALAGLSGLIGIGGSLIRGMKMLGSLIFRRGATAVAAEAATAVAGAAVQGAAGAAAGAAAGTAGAAAGTAATTGGVLALLGGPAGVAIIVGAVIAAVGAYLVMHEPAAEKRPLLPPGTKLPEEYLTHGMTPGMHEQIVQQRRQRGAENIMEQVGKYVGDKSALTPEQRAQRDIANLGNMFVPDLAKIREQIKQSEDALNEARMRELKAGKGAIAAYVVEYEHMAEKVKGNTVAIANYRLAMESNVRSEVKRIHEESLKEQLKLEEEMVHTVREREMAAAQVIPDETLAGRKRAIELETQAQIDQVDSNVKIKTDEITRKTKLEIEGAEKTGQDVTQITQDAEKERGTIFITGEIKKNAIRLQGERKTNEAILEDRKALDDAIMQGQIQVIQRAATLQISSLEAVRTATLAQRKKQITDITNLQVIAIDQTADEEIARENQKYADMLQSREMLELNVTRIARDADTQRQLTVLNGWKETDQAILQQQEELYNDIKNVAGGFWDAMMTKSKSVWASLGSFMKSTILGFMKAVVTSSIAAQFARIFGGYQVTFPRGAWRPPYFPGAGAPPGIGPNEPAATTAIDFGGAIAPGAGMGILTEAYKGLGGGIGGYPAGVAPTYSAMGGGGFGGGAGYMGAGDFGYGQTLPTNVPGYTPGGGGLKGTLSGYGAQAKAIRDSFNIGKPITVPGEHGFGTKTIPWAQATARQRIGSILSSPGMGAAMSAIGVPMFMSSLQGRGTFRGLQGIAGGALAGAGIAAMFGAPMIGGLQAGIGAGIAAWGLKRGGVSGLFMSTGGMALAGATIGTMIMPGIGTVIGAAVGAAAGLTAGLVRLFHKTRDERLRALIKQAYGIDIPDQKIRKQIMDLADQKYGGNDRLAVFSTDVQDLIRMYSLSTGQNPAGLARPMYAATYAQSAAGGLQLQPVYSHGQMIANPYTGTTTTEMQNWVTAAQQGPMFLQLNPQQAVSLFSGQVVQVLGDNPGAVSSANTTAAQSGQGRTAQASALMEPATVTR